MPVAPWIKSCCVACARLCVSVVGQTDNSVWNLNGGHRIAQTFCSMLTKPWPCAKHAQQFAYHLADSIIRHNLLLSSHQPTLAFLTAVRSMLGNFGHCGKVRHTKKLMSVILPSLAIGHTHTEELCFLLLFSAAISPTRPLHINYYYTTTVLFCYDTQTNTRCSY